MQTFSEVNDLDAVPDRTQAHSIIGSCKPTLKRGTMRSQAVRGREAGHQQNPKVQNS
jgi:hypothetical protein